MFNLIVSIKNRFLATHKHSSCHWINPPSFRAFEDKDTCRIIGTTITQRKKCENKELVLIVKQTEFINCQNLDPNGTGSSLYAHLVTVFLEEVSIRDGYAEKTGGGAYFTDPKDKVIMKSVCFSSCRTGRIAEDIDACYIGSNGNLNVTMDYVLDLNCSGYSYSLYLQLLQTGTTNQLSNVNTTHCRESHEDWTATVAIVGPMGYMQYFSFLNNSGIQALQVNCQTRDNKEQELRNSHIVVGHGAWNILYSETEFQVTKCIIISNVKKYGNQTKIIWDYCFFSNDPVVSGTGNVFNKTVHTNLDHFICYGETPALVMEANPFMMLLGMSF